DETRGLGGPRLVAVVVDGDVRAAAGQLQRRRLPDPAPRARDEGDGVLQLHVPLLISGGALAHHSRRALALCPPSWCVGTAPPETPLARRRRCASPPRSAIHQATIGAAKAGAVTRAAAPRRRGSSWGGITTSSARPR